MKKRNILTIILAGFLIVPIFIALYKVNTSFNLPLAIPTKNSFQLSALTSFNDNWSLPIPDPDKAELDCRIAIDSNNIIHIVYVNSSVQTGIIYSNSSNYTNVRKVSNNPNNDEGPAIAVRNNIVYVIWQAFDGSHWDIVISNSSDYFSTNFTISKNVSEDDINPDIAVDSTGVVHVVWEGVHNITGIKDIWYTNSSNNYKDLIIVNNNPDNTDVTPSIAIGPDDSIHIAWLGDIPAGDEIFYTNSTDNFQSNQTISNNPTETDNTPDIIATNQVFITWGADPGTGDYEIFIANSSNNWENQSISKNPGISNWDPRIVKDGGNNLHLVWTTSGPPYLKVYVNSLDNYQKNTTISDDSDFNTPADIAIGNDGRIYIIWAYNNKTYQRNSTYPDYPAVKAKSILFPMELNKPGTAMLALGEFYDEFYIDKVEIMWSTNTGVSWNTFLMFGSGNGTKWKGTGFIPGYQYGVVLLYKFKITDKAGQDHETAQKIFYYPDTRIESIVLIIILFGVLGTLTALYLIPQTRNFFGKLFSRKEPETTKKPKKPEVEKTPES